MFAARNAFMTGNPPVPAQLTGVTYTQSSVYGPNAAATYAGMNDNSAVGNNGINQTGTKNEAAPFIKADCGSTRYVSKIVIGYDYQSNLPGSWGVSYTEGRTIQGSNDNTNWTTITTAPTYSTTGSSNGLVDITVNANYRYIRLYSTSGYICLLEFQIWGY